MLARDALDHQRLRDGEALSRAVHLLQYLVDGSMSEPEPGLALNKILCGAALEEAVEKEIALTEEERQVCEHLLKSMIANWSVIENTSIDGLQQTFLRREGKLEQTRDGWKLLIQRKTVDVLVDQIPWSISVIFHEWMPQPLFVKW